MDKLYTSFLKQSTISEIMNAPWRAESKRETYVARGAYMYCTMGTHEEVLNQLEPNGVYINDNKMMTVKDCVPSSSEEKTFMGFPIEELKGEMNGNFYSFGFCRSALNPMKIAHVATGDSGPSYIYNYDPDTKVLPYGEEHKIFPCVPKLMPHLQPTPMGYAMGMNNSSLTSISGVPNFAAMMAGLVKPSDGVEWDNGSSNVMIDGVPALTTKSCLTCKYGGKIQLLTNGMEPTPPEFLER
ncbi:DUF4280 domain-containing protein [Paenibacillus lautus]|uniref:DUF4280 domain-containing protein n=1 Tax=Paenibacillus lautus TaxID=1401 RepID=UPI003D2E7053